MKADTILVTAGKSFLKGFSMNHSLTNSSDESFDKVLQQSIKLLLSDPLFYGWNQETREELCAMSKQLAELEIFDPLEFDKHHERECLDMNIRLAYVRLDFDRYKSQLSPQEVEAIRAKNVADGLIYVEPKPSSMNEKLEAFEEWYQYIRVFGELPPDDVLDAGLKYSVKMEHTAIIFEITRVLRRHIQHYKAIVEQGFTTEDSTSGDADRPF